MDGTLDTLNMVARLWNAGDREQATATLTAAGLRECLEPAFQRLAVYGSLAPGRANHHRIAHLPGRWRSGTVHGELAQRGWGAAIGFAGLIWNPAGPEVPVQLLESPALPEAWATLDSFEGADYRRILAPVRTPEGVYLAQLYALSVESQIR